MSGLMDIATSLTPVSKNEVIAPKLRDGSYEGEHYTFSDEGRKAVWETCLKKYTDCLRKDKMYPDNKEIALSSRMSNFCEHFNQLKFGVSCPWPIDSDGAEVIKANPEIVKNKGLVLLLPFANVDFIRQLSVKDKQLLMTLMGRDEIFDFGRHTGYKALIVRAALDHQIILPAYITGLLATVELVGLNNVIEVYNLRYGMMDHKSFKTKSISFEHHTEYASDLVLHRMLTGCLYEFFQIASNPLATIKDLAYKNPYPAMCFRNLPDAVTVYNHYSTKKNEQMGKLAAMVVFETYPSSMEMFTGEFFGEANNRDRKVDIKNRPNTYKFIHLNKIDRWINDYTLEVTFDELEEYNQASWGEIDNTVHSLIGKVRMEDFVVSLKDTLVNNAKILCTRMKVTGKAPQKLYRLALQPGITYVDFSEADFSECEAISCLFFGENTLETVILPDYGMHNIKDTSYAFAGCTSLKELDCKGLFLDSVTNASNMFSGCKSLAKVQLDGYMRDGFIATSMFSGCYYLYELHMQPQNAEQCIVDGMFAGCMQNTIPEWYEGLLNTKMETYGEDSEFTLVEFSELLRNKEAYKDIDKLKITTSGTQMDTHLVQYTGHNTFYSAHVGNTGSRSNKFESLFRGYKSSVIDISEVDFGSERIFNSMFEGCTNLEEIISDFRCKPSCCDRMFSGCVKLTKVNLSNIDFSNCKNISYMFQDCSSLEMKVNINAVKLAFNTNATEKSKVTIEYTNVKSLTHSLGGFATEKSLPDNTEFEDHFLYYLQCLGYCGQYITKTASNDHYEWDVAAKCMTQSARVYELLIYNICMRLASTVGDEGPKVAVLGECCNYYAGLGLPVQSASGTPEIYSVKVAFANMRNVSSKRGYHGMLAGYRMNVDKVFPSVQDINNMGNQIHKICQDAIGYGTIGKNGASYNMFCTGILISPGDLGGRPRVTAAIKELMRVFAKICTSKAFEISWPSLYQRFTSNAEPLNLYKNALCDADFYYNKDWSNAVIDIIKKR